MKEITKEQAIKAAIELRARASKMTRAERDKMQSMSDKYMRSLSKKP